MDTGILSDSQLDTVIAPLYGDIYHGLDDTQRKHIRNELRHSDLTVSVADLNTAGIKNLWDKKELRGVLTSSVAEGLMIETIKEIPIQDRLPEERIKIRKDIERQRKQDIIDEGDTGETLPDEDYDMFDEFREELKNIKDKDGKSIHIPKIDTLKEGSIIEYKHHDGSTQYMRITKVREADGKPMKTMGDRGYGISIEPLPVRDNILKSWSPFHLTYEELEWFLRWGDCVDILDNDTFEAKLTVDANTAHPDEKILDRRALAKPISTGTITTHIDEIDPKGSKYGFEKWTVFIAPVIDAKTGKIGIGEQAWTVARSSDDTVDLIDPWGNKSEKNISLSTLYAYLQTVRFRRIHKITNEIDMLHALQECGVAGDTEIKDGRLMAKVSSHDNHDDAHGKHDDTKEREITCFTSESGWHIRMRSIENGIVEFGEYESKEELKKVKEHGESHGLDKKILGQYKWRQMSYGEFMRYLKEHNLKASEHDVIVPDANHIKEDHHGHHPHLHKSILSRIMQMQNPASIWKWFEMIVHGIEHVLEKWAQLDAAKFALRVWGLIWLPDSVQGEVFAKVVEWSRGIVEKMEKELAALPGPKWRLECLHIISNIDSRPEDVAAAMNFMLKWYGHLYAEDLKHQQSEVKSRTQFINAPHGTFLFFDAFVTTAKMGKVEHWRKEAYDKAIQEMGTLDDHEGEPTEEQLIHALFKMLDGDWEKYPYAASVMKALGGPGGFETTWKEGYKKAKDKGKEQTKMVNKQWRLNKAVGYLETGEFYKAMGSMEWVADKWKTPALQAMPFIMAVGGYTRYMSHWALQDLKWYASSSYSFHAYAFLREYKDNQLYKKVVTRALAAKFGESVASKFTTLAAKLEYNPGKPKATKWAAKEMMTFWQQYCDQGLHDMLQWHDGWLVSEYHKEKADTHHGSDITAYISKLDGVHSEHLNDPDMSGETTTDWFNEYGLKMNRTMKFDKETGLRSLQRTLNKITFQGTRVGWFSMPENIYDKLWSGIIQQVDLLKNDPYLPKETKEKQFKYYRQEILNHFSEKMGVASTPSTPEQIETYIHSSAPFWRDFEKVGIDPRNIFRPSAIAKKNADMDYQNWTQGIVGGGSHHGTDDVRAYVRSVAKKETIPKPI
jgi:hypothetical protein